MRRPADKIENLHARIDPKLRKSAERTSIRNEKTVAAMVEANDAPALKRYRSFRDVRDRI